MLKAKKIVYQFLVFAAVLSVHTVVAQNDDLAPVTDTYAITNATIVQAPGRVISSGTILISNGLIKQVGTSVTIPSNAKVIDVDSMYVYAGFIDGLSQAGIPRPEDKQRPRDVLAMDPPYEWAGISPQNSSVDFLDASDKALSQLREAGFTIAQVVPKGQMLPGKGALIVLSGDTKEDMIIKNNSTLFAQLTGARGVFPNTVIGVMAKWRDLYNNASNAKTHIDNYRTNPSGLDRPTYDPVLEALIPITTKQMNVTFDASSDLDIHRVLTLQKDLGFNLVLGNVELGSTAVNKIKSSGASVLMSYDLPKEQKVDSSNEMKTEREKEIAALEKRKVEAYKLYVEQAAKMQANGIMFGFSGMSGKPSDVKKNLNIMIANGLSEDAALAALTTNAASILGISNIAGSIDAGKMANLVVSTGPYFAEKSAIRYVFADGDMYEYEIKEKKKSNGGSGDAAVLVGTWTYSANDGDGESTGVLTFVDQGGSIGGTMTNSNVPVSGDISDVSVDGDEITFVITFSMDGQEFNADASVSVTDGSMQGELVTPFGSASLSAEKDPNN